MTATRYEFFAFEDKGNKWRWRLIAGNGKIVADSGEAYADKDNAERAIDQLKMELGIRGFDREEFMLLRREDFAAVRKRFVESPTANDVLQLLEQAQV